jgi:flagellar hook assembly protein FlgD
MTAPETWTFTTFGFSKATVVNNRLGAGGGASECLIFVPQSEADDRVSVQVFTTTGRLVRTFCKNKAYSSVDVPIRWDGTNDKGKDLGPGLYFVQIVVNGVKQTLKVLIVR